MNHFGLLQCLCGSRLKSPARQGHSLASIGDTETSDDDEIHVTGLSCKPLKNGVLGHKKTSLAAMVATKKVNEAEGTRTLNLRIDSPML